MRTRNRKYRLAGLGAISALVAMVGMIACTTEKEVEVPVLQTVVVRETVIVPQIVEVPVTVTPGPTSVPAATAAPRPTATPLPTATPAPGLDDLILAVDMVRGHTDPQGPTCALTSRYQRGEMVTWRMRVTDPATGKQLPAEPAELLAMTTPPDSAASESLASNITATVHLGDGQEAAMAFHPHSGNNPVDYFWTWGWVIPDDYPTGTLDYYVTVDWPEGGKNGRWDPFAVGISKLTISERVTGDLILAADLVRGHTDPQGPTCALTSRYQRGEMVVWRLRITDPDTGAMLPANPVDLLAMEIPPDADAAAALAEGIVVTAYLSDGQEFPMHFGPHSGNNPVDYFWTSSWVIPEDYPTGTLDYYITAEWPENEKSGRWDPIAVGSSKLTVELLVTE